MMHIYYETKFFLYISLIAILCGCDQSQGRDLGGNAEHERNMARPFVQPSAQDILAATGPDYKTRAGGRQECLGRLIFDVEQVVQWPVFHNRNQVNNFYASFSENTYHQGDKISIGNVKISVFGPINEKLLSDLRSETPWASIDSYKRYIQDNKKLLVNLKKEKETQKIIFVISGIEEGIKSREESIVEFQKRYTMFDSGLEKSEGYSFLKAEGGDSVENYSVYHARLVRDGHIYIFESTEELTEKFDRESHKRQFVAMLAKFRPRKASEIPAELGVCIPHGFIADDGKTATDIKQSLRWPDAPGVLYTIHTGTVDERKMKTPLITAAGSAAVGLLGSYAESEVKPFVTERIGPRPYQIGGLKASQGGVALKISRPGKTPFEAYNVFTGYSGWLGTEALPFILVEMSTRTMEQASELKQNPPPFQHSMGRLETLLKSTRLRPTTPLMPDLENLPK